MNATRWILAAVAVVTLAGAIACTKGDPTSETSYAAGPVAFVDDTTCAQCHSYEWQRWAGSHHDLAMQAATEETVLGDFEDAVFANGGEEMRFFRRDGRYLVRAPGPDGVVADHPIEATFGVDPLQQYLVRFPGGRLQCLTVAWNVAEERWFTLYPDDEIAVDDALHWTGRYQRWNLMCADCHSTDLRKGYDAETDSYETTYREINVGCQACHGPGAEHVSRMRAAPEQSGTPAESGLVVGLKREAAAAQLNACAPCHSRRYRLTEDYEFGADFLDHYVPERLHEGYYHPDGQMLDEVYVYGSFIQSKMHLRGVACTDCHDPHALELLAPGNGVCTQCHTTDPPVDRFPTLQAKLYDDPSHHFHPIDSKGAQCVECHMTERTYMVIDPRRDHSFRIPRPALTLTIGTPNACTACHADREAQWAVEQVTEWYGEKERVLHYGEILAGGRIGEPAALGPLAMLAADAEAAPIVRATALELLGRAGSQAMPAVIGALTDAEPLVRLAALRGLDRPQRSDSGMSLPDEAKLAVIGPLLTDPLRAIRVEAARLLGGIPLASVPEGDREALATGLEEFLAAQALQADVPWSHLNLGVYHADRGEREASLASYRKALELDPDFLPARFNLANALNAVGRNEEAERVLREGTARHPEEGELFYSHGLLLAEMNRAAEAAEALERAGVLLPGRARIHYNRGLLLQQIGRLDEAEAALILALKEDDRDPDVLNALMFFYTNRELWERALPYAERFVELYPRAPGPAEELARIRAQLEAR